MSQRFKGKTALITGASLGIGRGIALCLAEEGANIVVNYRRSRDAAEDVAAQVKAMGQDALTWQADVSDREAMAAMFAAAIDHFGRLDVVVANAAMSIRESIIDAEWENVHRTLEVSQFGVFHTCQLAAQHMVTQPLTERSRGKIVIISSVHEEVAVAGSAAYNMAKAAINHLTRTLAVEMTPHRINVNVINPGWIDTPGERKFYTEAEIEEGGRQLPWGRIGQPEDIGKAVAFLASDDADYITGTMLRVDGGYVVARSTAD